MRKVLFVGGGREVCAELLRRVEEQPNLWQLTFVLDAAQANEALREASYQLVVMDMQQRHTDPVEFMESVRRNYPTLARIGLSRQVDPRMALRAVGGTFHQYIDRDADPRIVLAVMESTCDLCDMVHDETLKSVMFNIDSLPAAPTTFIDLYDAAESETSNLKDIANIVTRDPGIAAKIMQIVNSSFFGQAKPCASIEQAVTTLGLDLVRNLALAFNVFNTTVGDDAQLERIWDHSMATALLAKRFLQPSPEAEAAFTAGLMHDIGHVVLEQAYPEQIAAVKERMRQTGEPRWRVEKAILKVTHAEVGARLLTIWGLPFAVTQAVAYHHAPGAVASPHGRILGAVHAADALSKAPGGELLHVATLRKMGLAEEMETWQKMAKQREQVS